MGHPRPTPVTRWPPLWWECLACQVDLHDECAGDVVFCECLGRVRFRRLVLCAGLFRGQSPPPRLPVEV